MSAWHSDTHPKMEALQIQLLKQTTTAQKLKMLAELNSSARMLAIIGLRSQYPHASENEIQRRLADLLLGEELAYKVYGDLVDAACTDCGHSIGHPGF
jgi:hypothetical protein